MHMGYPYLEETKAIMGVYPQVYADISVIDWILPKEEFYNYLKALVTAGFGKRLMYGSDQMIWEDAIPLSIQNLESVTFLNEQQKQDIFYNNASKFFNIR
jgi:predicted TIM-barrel fold metal-dependent hydrolase